MLSDSALLGLPAPAKLNLFLHVVGRRPDGKHLLESVFTLIDLHDTIDLFRLEEPVVERTGDVIGIIPTLDATVFVAMTEDGKLARGFETLYTEMEKVRRYGFTQGEFERAQENLMRQAERSYANRNDRRNNEFVQTYLNNYQKNQPMPDAETEWQLDSMLIKMLIGGHGL